MFVNNFKTKLIEENFWITNYASPKYYNWAGYAFEIVCLNHIVQIKKALGIGGIQTNTSSWANDMALIDLIIDRADNVINIFEIKHSKRPFIISKKYDLELRNKLQKFSQVVNTKKTIWPIFIAPFGLGKSPYNHFFVTELKMDSLFDKN